MSETQLSADERIALIKHAVIGGCVGLQRRLKTLPDQDLRLIAESWVYTSWGPCPLGRFEQRGRGD